MVNLDAEKAEIERQIRLMEAAENRHDLETMLRMMTEDAIVELSGPPMLQGREAIRQAYAEFFKLFISTSLTCLGTFVAASGEMAWQFGTHVNKMKTPEGEIGQPGKWLCVFHKIGGEWKTAAISIT